MLKEVIVVEGKSDTAAIRRALEADTKQRIKSAALLYLLTLTEQATAYAAF